MQRLSRPWCYALPSPPLPARFRARTQQTNWLCDQRRLPRRLIAQRRCTGGLTSQLIHCCTPRRLPCSIQTITTRGYSLLLTVTGAPLLGRQLIGDVHATKLMANRCVRVFSVFLDVSRGSHLPFRELQQPRYVPARFYSTIKPRVTKLLAEPRSATRCAHEGRSPSFVQQVHRASRTLATSASARCPAHCSPIVCGRPPG